MKTINVSIQNRRKLFRRLLLCFAALSLAGFLPATSNAADPVELTTDSRNTNVGRQPLLYAVVIIDTNAKDLTQCLLLDFANLWEYLLVPVSQHGRLGGLCILSGNSATGDNVRQAIRSLPVEKADTLMVYYAGHGGINAIDGVHYLTMKNGNLSRTLVEQEIAARRPQLGLLITDCCSNYFLPPRTYATMPVAPRTANWHTIEKLFFNLKGMVSVTAVRPGQLAYAPLFTYAFCSALTATPAELGIGQQNWSRFLRQIPARSRLYGNLNIEQSCHTYKLGAW